MTRTACLMMQKDETLLLRPWLLYHGHLFGFENLYVYDNGSTAGPVLAVLREFAAVGVHVEYAHAAPQDFEHKGWVLGARIAAFRDADAYDIALPMDCDEFLAIEGEGGPACDRAAVLAELARIDAAGVVCRTAYCLDNRPGHLDLFRCVPHVKSVVVVRAFHSIDHGFHQAALAPGQDYGETALIHLHLHFKPFPLVLESAANKLRPFVDVDDRIALAAHSGVGHHLKQYFFLSAAEYHADLRGYKWPLLRFGGLTRILAAWMDVSVLRRSWEAGRPSDAAEDGLVIELDGLSFRKAAYLDANPDLDGPHVTPFLHFVRAGFEEGRRVDASSAGWEEVAARLAGIRAARADGRAGYAGAALPLARLGRGAEADALLEAAIGDFGETAMLLREYALSAMYQERPEAAVARWEHMRRFAPDAPDAYRYGALARRLAGDLPGAEALVQAGLELFADDLPMRLERARIASQGGQWALARALWEALVSAYPDNAEVTESATVAAFTFRLSRLEQRDEQQHDATLGPAPVGMSAADMQLAAAAMGVADAAALQQRFMQFESLGHSCEFGLVQRRFGAEPIGLLRWNSIHLPQLVPALEQRFGDIERPENLVLAEAGGEYVLRDLTYLTTMHSFVRVGQAEPERLLVQQGRRLAFLRRKLMEDLAAGEKRFVHLDDERRSDAEVQALHRAFRACSPGMLLYVRVAERAAQIGTVEAAGDGLLIGHIDRLGRGADDRWNISIDAWLKLCRAACEHQR